MLLDDAFRESLVDDLDEMLEAYADNPDQEAITQFVIEQLEVYADEHGIDDIVVQLEADGALEAPLQETLETELASNDELELTGEEIVSLLERVCNIEWDDLHGDDDDWEGDDDEDDEDDEDEDEDED